MIERGIRKRESMRERNHWGRERGREKEGKEGCFRLSQKNVYTYSEQELDIDATDDVTHSPV